MNEEIKSLIKAWLDRIYECADEAHSAAEQYGRRSPEHTCRLVVLSDAAKAYETACVAAGREPYATYEPTSLPDIEIFRLTAHEVAAMDEDLIFEYMKRPDYRLAAMNSSDQENMLGAMVAEEGIEGGWYYWYCFPGCLPDSEAIGPFPSPKAALKAAQYEQQES